MHAAADKSADGALRGSELMTSSTERTLPTLTSTHYTSPTPPEGVTVPSGHIRWSSSTMSRDAAGISTYRFFCKLKASTSFQEVKNQPERDLL